MWGASRRGEVVAVTKGHGNPDWSHEEVVLALELYQECEDQVPGPSDERVCELSRLLRSFPYHAEAARKESFRNPAGVAFKLQNLKSVRTGRGLKNTSQVDREVWAEFGLDRVRTRARAELIRRSIGVLEELPNLDEVEFAEGASVTKLHLGRERARGLRKEIIKKRLKLGGLSCDICSFDGGKVLPALREAIFECHHVIPLNQVGESKTKVSDTALLCSSCHRALHKAIAANKRWYSVDEARHLFFDWRL